jgi:GDPmannose 4,6-dehydratase
VRRALVVGSGGQDGRLVTDLLTERGYLVAGVERTLFRIGHDAHPAIDILNAGQVAAAIADVRPDEIYYLAAFHHSSEEREIDELLLHGRSHECHVQGLINILEAVRRGGHPARLFYAASSHVFGDPDISPQDERTPLNPNCIYGITKTAGIHLCRYYRRVHGVHASAGILYNHESRYRRKEFVSQKIVRGALDIKAGRAEKLVLGNLSAAVDWGYAPDYADAMTRILALTEPDDFVIASGAPHTVLDFVRAAFEPLGLDWRAHVEERPGLITKRKSNLVGDASKLRSATGWQPSVSFEEMVARLLPNEAPAIEEGT